MANEKENALRLTPSGALEKVGHGPKQILSGMVSDALVLARTQTEPALVLHRIGDYEFRDPDYRQILTWAESLGLGPEEVIGRLAESKASEPDTLFRVHAGRILSFVWDFRLLPILSFGWLSDLHIEHISFRGVNTSDFIIRLETLRSLYCSNIGLRKLHLARVPKLTRLRCDTDLATLLSGLHCGSNQLTELDLSCVPNLTELHCQLNSFTELDLSRVPNLTELHCGSNQLTELDLSCVPKLTKLDCGDNELTELDLSCVPNLTELDCWDNELTELDLSRVPKLTKLDCGVNELTELDLSRVSNLTELGCWGNQLTELDLSRVPNLTELGCSGNQLTDLDLQANSLLRCPRCDDELVLKNLHK